MELIPSPKKKETSFSSAASWTFGSTTKSTSTRVLSDVWWFGRESFARLDGGGRPNVEALRDTSFAGAHTTLK